MDNRRPVTPELTTTLDRLTVPDDRAKLAFMRAGAHRDATRPLIVQTASRLVSPFRADDYWSQASALHRFVRDAIRYQRDPDRREQLADARVPLTRGYGDCDDKVRLFTALANAIGLEADTWPIWKGDELSHVQTAVRWPGSAKLTIARTAPAGLVDAPEGGGWIVSDPTIRGAELGIDPTHLPRNDAGRLPLT